MGEANRRGAFEDRRVQAIVQGRADNPIEALEVLAAGLREFLDDTKPAPDAAVLKAYQAYYMWAMKHERGLAGARHTTVTKETLENGNTSRVYRRQDGVEQSIPDLSQYSHLLDAVVEELNA